MAKPFDALKTRPASPSPFSGGVPGAGMRFTSAPKPVAPAKGFGQGQNVFGGKAAGGVPDRRDVADAGEIKRWITLPNGQVIPIKTPSGSQHLLRTKGSSFFFDPKDNHPYKLDARSPSGIKSAFEDVEAMPDGAGRLVKKVAGQTLDVGEDAAFVAKQAAATAKGQAAEEKKAADAAKKAESEAKKAEAAGLRTAKAEALVTIGSAKEILAENERQLHLQTTSSAKRAQMIAEDLRSDGYRLDVVDQALEEASDPQIVEGLKKEREGLTALMEGKRKQQETFELDAQRAALREEEYLRGQIGLESELNRKKMAVATMTNTGRLPSVESTTGINAPVATTAPAPTPKPEVPLGQAALDAGEDVSAVVRSLYAQQDSQVEAYRQWRDSVKLDGVMIDRANSPDGAFWDGKRWLDVVPGMKLDTAKEVRAVVLPKVEGMTLAGDEVKVGESRIGEVWRDEAGVPSLLMARNAPGVRSSPSLRSGNPYDGVPEYAEVSPQFIDGLQREGAFAQTGEAIPSEMTRKAQEQWAAQRWDDGQVNGLLTEWRSGNDRDRAEIVKRLQPEAAFAEPNNPQSWRLDTRKLYLGGQISLQQARLLEREFYGVQPGIKPLTQAWQEFKSGESETAKRLAGIASNVLSSPHQIVGALEQASSAFLVDYYKANGHRADFDLAEYNQLRESLAAGEAGRTWWTAQVDNALQNAVGSSAGILVGMGKFFGTLPQALGGPQVGMTPEEWALVRDGTLYTGAAMRRNLSDRGLFTPSTWWEGKEGQAVTRSIDTLFAKIDNETLTETDFDDLAKEIARSSIQQSQRLGTPDEMQTTPEGWDIAREGLLNYYDPSSPQSPLAGLLMAYQATRDPAIRAQFEQMVRSSPDEMEFHERTAAYASAQGTISENDFAGPLRLGFRGGQVAPMQETIVEILGTYASVGIGKALATGVRMAKRVQEAGKAMNVVQRAALGLSRMGERWVQMGLREGRPMQNLLVQGAKQAVTSGIAEGAEEFVGAWGQTGATLGDAFVQSLQGAIGGLGLAPIMGGAGVAVDAFQQMRTQRAEMRGFADFAAQWTKDHPDDPIDAAGVKQMAGYMSPVFRAENAAAMKAAAEQMEQALVAAQQAAKDGPPSPEVMAPIEEAHAAALDTLKGHAAELRLRTVAAKEAMQEINGIADPTHRAFADAALKARMGQKLAPREVSALLNSVDETGQALAEETEGGWRFTEAGLNALAESAPMTRESFFPAEENEVTPSPERMEANGAPVSTNGKDQTTNGAPVSTNGTASISGQGQAEVSGVPVPVPTPDGAVGDESSPAAPTPPPTTATTATAPSPAPTEAEGRTMHYVPVKITLPGGAVKTMDLEQMATSPEEAAQRVAQSPVMQAYQRRGATVEVGNTAAAASAEATSPTETSTETKRETTLPQPADNARNLPQAAASAAETSAETALPETDLGREEPAAAIAAALASKQATQKAEVRPWRKVLEGIATMFGHKLVDTGLPFGYVDQWGKFHSFGTQLLDKMHPGDAIGQWIDKVGNASPEVAAKITANMSQPFYHRVWFGHDPAANIATIVDKFGVGAVPDYIGQLLKDFMTKSGVPLPGAQWLVHSGLVGDETATKWLSLNVGEAFSGGLALLGSWKLMKKARNGQEIHAGWAMAGIAFKLVGGVMQSNPVLLLSGLSDAVVLTLAKPAAVKAAFEQVAERGDQAEETPEAAEAEPVAVPEEAKVPWSKDLDFLPAARLYPAMQALEPRLRMMAWDSALRLNATLGMYAENFPGGIRFSEKRAANLWVDQGGTLNINLPHYLRDTAQTTTREAIMAMVEEELAHIAAMRVMTDTEVVNLWKSLPAAMQRQVYKAYHVADIANKRVPSEPKGDWGSSAWNYGHEFVRMLVTDREFQGRVAEAVEVDPGFGAKIVAWLKTFIARLRQGIEALPPAQRSAVKEYEYRVRQALREMLKLPPLQKPTAEQTKTTGKRIETLRAWVRSQPKETSVWAALTDKGDVVSIPGEAATTPWDARKQLASQARVRGQWLAWDAGLAGLNVPWADVNEELESWQSRSAQQLALLADPTIVESLKGVDDTLQMLPMPTEEDFSDVGPPEIEEAQLQRATIPKQMELGLDPIARRRDLRGKRDLLVMRVEGMGDLVARKVWDTPEQEAKLRKDLARYEALLAKVEGKMLADYGPGEIERKVDKPVDMQNVNPGQGSKPSPEKAGVAEGPKVDTAAAVGGRGEVRSEKSPAAEGKVPSPADAKAAAIAYQEEVLADAQATEAAKEKARKVLAKLRGEAVPAAVEVAAVSNDTGESAPESVNPTPELAAPAEKAPVSPPPAAPATIGQENINARPSVAWADVSTPGTMSNPNGTLRAAATKSKAPSGVWYFAGDIRQLAFEENATVNGKSGATPSGQQLLAEAKAVQAAGWTYTNVKASGFGTAWVFRKGDQVLTRAGAAALASGKMERPEVQPSEAGYQSMIDRFGAFSAKMVEWLQTLKPSTLDSASALSNKLGNGLISKWVRLVPNPYSTGERFSLQFLKEDGATELALFGDTVDRIVEEVARYAAAWRDRTGEGIDPLFRAISYEEQQANVWRKPSETLAALGFPPVGEEAPIAPPPSATPTTRLQDLNAPELLSPEEWLATGRSEEEHRKLIREAMGLGKRRPVNAATVAAYEMTPPALYVRKGEQLVYGPLEAKLEEQKRRQGKSKKGETSPPAEFGSGGVESPKPKREKKPTVVQMAEAYFEPGKIVPGYGKTFDRVRAFRLTPDDGYFSVEVEEVRKKGDGWETIGQPRKHRTLPPQKELEKAWALRKAKDALAAETDRVAIEDTEEAQMPSPEKVTRAEWVALQRAERRRLGQPEQGADENKPWAEYEEFHRDAVERAVKAGAEVAPEVLKNYPWLQAEVNIRPYVASLREMPDAKLKAEEKRTTAELNNLPKLLGDRVKFHEVSERFNAVNREIEARKAKNTGDAPETAPVQPTTETALGGFVKNYLDPNFKRQASVDLPGSIAKLSLATSQADVRQVLQTVADLVPRNDQGGMISGGAAHRVWNELRGMLAHMERKGIDKATPELAPVQPTTAAAETPAKAEAKVEEHLQDVKATEGTRPAAEIKAELLATVTTLLKETRQRAAAETGNGNLSYEQLVKAGHGDLVDNMSFEKREFQIPGDGTFTMVLNGRNLAELLKRIKSLPVKDTGKVESSRGGAGEGTAASAKDVAAKLYTVAAVRSWVVNAINGDPFAAKVIEAYRKTDNPEGIKVDEIEAEVQALLNGEESAPVEPAAPAEAVAESPVETPAPAPEAAPITGLESLRAFLGRMYRNEATAAEVKAAFFEFKANAAQVRADLEKLTKAELGPYARARPGDKKEDMVRSAMTNLIGEFGRESILSFSMADYKDLEGAYFRKIEAGLDNWTDEVIAAEREGKAERKAAKEKALTNPETLDEWKQFVRKKGVTGVTKELAAEWNKIRDPYKIEAVIMERGEKELTPEQLAAYDAIRGINRKEMEQRAAEQKAAVQGVVMDAQPSDIIETVHTKKGTPLFVVQLSDRVEKPVYARLLLAAKKLGGYYSSFRGAGAVPGFQFKDRDTAEQFQAVARGESVDRTEAVEAKRKAKTTAAADRLRAVADGLEAKAQEALGKDRQTNTARRARMAAGAEADADRQLALAKTMRNLADAMASGEATHLDGVTAGTHVETLRGLAGSAKLNEERARNLSYDQREKEKYAAPTAAQMDHAVYSYPYMDKGSLLRLLEAARTTPGTKRLAEKMAKFSIFKDATKEGTYLRNETAIELVRDISKKVYDRGRLVWDEIAWKFETYDRLQKMGIKDLPSLRAALREFVEYSVERSAPDPLKVMERELVGQKIEGFFPTPRPLIDRMIDEAGDLTGKRVLEPSAGKGDIVQAAQEAGATVDAVEISSTLRKLLEAKGVNLIGRDIMDLDSPTNGEGYDVVLMNPPFENGQDMAHVQKAFEMLKPGGRLVAIVSAGPFYRQDKTATAFREWLDQMGGTHEPLPEGSFAGSDAFRQTGVRTEMVVVDKAEAGTLATGNRAAPASPIDTAAQAAAASPLNDLAEPTEAQKEAGNYAKGHVRIGGLDISIENPAGSVRRGTNANGKAWETTMQAHYGYVRGTEGPDGDHLDVFIAPGTPAEFRGTVYVVEQTTADGKAFDEHKAVFGRGINSPEAAGDLYHANYEADWKGGYAIQAMPWEQFKVWAQSSLAAMPLEGRTLATGNRRAIREVPKTQTSAGFLGSSGVSFRDAEAGIIQGLAGSPIDQGSTGGIVSGESESAATYALTGQSIPSHTTRAAVSTIVAEEARLIARAQAEGFFWDQDKTNQVLSSMRKVGGGSEHDVFLAGTEEHPLVIRSTINDSYGFAFRSPAQYLQRLEDYNRLFPELQIRLIGVSKNKRGNGVVWTVQPFIPGTVLASDEALQTAMERRGWKRIDKDYDENILYRHESTGVVMRDAHRGNVLQSGDQLYPIDVIIDDVGSMKALGTSNRRAPAASYDAAKAEGEARAKKAAAVKRSSVLTQVAGQRVLFKRDARSFWADVVSGNIDRIDYYAPGFRNIWLDTEREMALARAAVNSLFETLNSRARRGFGYPAWWKSKAVRAKWQEFQNVMLPTAARLEASGVNERGEFEFKDFMMRAGRVPVEVAEKAGLGVGDVMNVDGEALTLGPSFSVRESNATTGKGKLVSYHLLLRPISAAEQSATYKAFVDDWAAFPVAKELLDEFIMPGLDKGRFIGPRQFRTAEFNRYSLRDVYNEWPDALREQFGALPELEFSDGYVPEVPIKSGSAGVAGIIGELLRSYQSPARRFAKQGLRESGDVKNLFEGFQTQLMQAHMEKVRMERRGRLLKAAAVPEAQIPVADRHLWMPVNDAFEMVYEAVVLARNLDRGAFPALTGALNPEQVDLMRSIVGEAWMLRGRAMQIPAAIYNEMLAEVATAQTENLLLKLAQWFMQQFNAASLASFQYLGMNFIGNEILKVAFAVQSGYKAMLFAMSGRLEDKARARLALSTARYLMQGAILDRFPLRRERFREILPREIFDTNHFYNALQGMDEGVLDNVKKLQFGSAFLAAVRAGNWDVSAKVQLANAMYQAYAREAWRDAAKRDVSLTRLSKEKKRQWLKDYVANAPATVHREVEMAAGEWLMNYENTPRWMNSGAIKPFIDPTKPGKMSQAVMSAQLKKLAIAAFIPFLRWSYLFVRKVKRTAIDEGVRNIVGATGNTREGIANLMALGTLVAAPAMLTFLKEPGGDDDEWDKVEAQLLGRSRDMEGKDLDRTLKATNRFNVSALARIAYAKLGFMEDYNGEAFTVTDNAGQKADVWLRYRNYPFIKEGIVLGLWLQALRGSNAPVVDDRIKRSSGRVAGNITATDVFGQSWQALTGEYVSLGLGFTMLKSVLAGAMSGSQSADAMNDLRNSTVDLLTSPVLPHRLMRDIGVLVDPTDRRSRPSARLGYDPGWLETFMARIPGLKSKLPLDGEVAAPTILSAKSSVPPAEQAELLKHFDIPATAVTYSKDRPSNDTFLKLRMLKGLGAGPQDVGLSMSKTTKTAPKPLVALPKPDQVRQRNRWIEALRMMSPFNTLPVSQPAYRAAVTATEKKD